MVGRREFLRVGGLTAVTTAVLAACTDDDGGDTRTDSESSGATEASGADLAVLRGATERELTALGMYAAVLDADVLTTALVRDVELFRSHHAEHVQLLQRVLEDAGAEPVDETESTGGAQYPAVADEANGVRLLMLEETVLNSDYQQLAGGFDNLSLNQVAMTIGGVEARHAAFLSLLAGEDPITPIYQS